MYPDRTPSQPSVGPGVDQECLRRPALRVSPLNSYTVRRPCNLPGRITTMKTDILDEARRGTPFDEMAVLLRAPQAYWSVLEHALRRGDVPARFSQGTRT